MFMKLIYKCLRICKYVFVFNGIIILNKLIQEAVASLECVKSADTDGVFAGSINSAMPEVRGTAEFHGGAHPPCHAPPRTSS